MSDDSALTTFVMKLVETVQPTQTDVLRQITDLRCAYPSCEPRGIAAKWADRICWLYAAEGAITSAPGAIPGLGTAAQIAVESGAISIDLAYMLRCMGGMVMGVGHAFGRDVDAPFNQEFLRVLGLWCGALSLAKEGSVRIASKVAIAQFKRLPGEVFARINRKVGTTIVTKYGTKRGGIAVGRLIPFGVGVVVGGGFNLATMKGFKRAALKYYGTEDAVLVEE